MGRLSREMEVSLSLLDSGVGERAPCRGVRGENTDVEIGGFGGVRARGTSAPVGWCAPGVAIIGGKLYGGFSEMFFGG